jgi:hypothetical protein
MLLNEAVSLPVGDDGIPEGWISDVYDFTIEKEPLPTLDKIIITTAVPSMLLSFDLVSSPRTEGQYFIGRYTRDTNSSETIFFLEGSNNKIYFKYNESLARWEFWHDGYSTSYAYLRTNDVDKGKNPFAITEWDCNGTWDKITLKFGNYAYGLPSHPGGGGL